MDRDDVETMIRAGHPEARPVSHMVTGHHVDVAQLASLHIQLHILTQQERASERPRLGHFNQHARHSPLGTQPRQQANQAPLYGCFAITDHINRINLGVQIRERAQRPHRHRGPNKETVDRHQVCQHAAGPGEVTHIDLGFQDHAVEGGPYLGPLHAQRGTIKAGLGRGHTGASGVELGFTQDQITKRLIGLEHLADQLLLMLGHRLLTLFQTQIRPRRLQRSFSVGHIPFIITWVDLE